MAVFYSAQDFARALLALLPSGRVWPKDLESTQGLFMQALAQVYVRQTARSRNLVVDAFRRQRWNCFPNGRTPLVYLTLAPAHRLRLGSASHRLWPD